MSPNCDWKEFIESLNSNGAEYVIVGAVALAWHGYPRYTGDVDVLIRQNHSNVRRVLTARADFGFSSLGIDTDDLLAP